MKILHVFNNVFAMPDEGSGEKTHNYFMSEAFNKIGCKMVPFEPSSFSKKSNTDINVKRGFYRKLKNFLPKIVTDWLRDLYCVLYDFKFDKIILKVIEREQPDLIFERITSYHDSGLRAARKAGIPYAVEIHEMHNALSYKERTNFEWYRKLLWIKVAKQADLVVVVSTMLKQYLIDEGVSAEIILVLPNAVDPELFKVTNKGCAIRKKFNIYDETILGFVGCMHAYHGIDLLPELCSLLLEKGLDIKIMLVGSFDRWPGGKQAYINALINEGVEHYFILVGGVDVHEVPGYIEAMDIGLMPDSNDYGSPIKIFEYGALAKPVVVPNYPPVKDVIVDSINGLIFESKSMQAMATKINTLLVDKPSAKRLGDKLQQDVLSKHTWEKNAALIVERFR